MVNATRREKGSGSVYRVDRGFEAAISFVGRDGKRKRRRRLAPTAELAYEQLRELRTEAAAGHLEHPPSTVRHFFASWLKTVVAPNTEASTYAGYRSAIENHILPYVGNELFGAMDAAACSELLADLHRAGIEGRTRQTVYSVLRMAFEHAITIGAADANPLERIRRPKHERKQIKPFDASEVRRIISAAADDRHPQFAALYTLAFSTGARLGELFGLRWGDWSARELRIDRAVSEVDGRLITKRPKNRASIRTVELTAEAVEQLVLIRPADADDDHMMFSGKRGGALRRSTFARSYWGPTLAAAGVSPRGFHHARHTFATLSLIAGVPVHVVARILGHASAARTLRTYAHYVDGDQRVAVRAMSAVLTPPDALEGV